MAKQCDVCHQEYPDDLPACPHCASAKKTQLAGGPVEDRKTQLAGGPAEDRKTQLAGGPDEARKTQLADVNPADLDLGPAAAESGVDLGHPVLSVEGGIEPPAPSSGSSAVDWAALAEGPASEEVKIDAPSDAEVLATLESPPVEAGPAEEGAHLSHEEETPSSGAPLLNLSPEEAAAVLPPDTDEDIIGGLLVEETAAPAPSGTDAEAEVIDLAAAPPEPVDALSESAVDLGAPPIELVEDSGAVVEEAAPPSGSAIFMAELASDASHVELVSGSGVNLVDEDEVDLVAEAEAAPLANSSERDVLAEAAEAGIDQGTPEADLAEEVALDAAEAGEHASAIDLGATFVPPSDEPASAEEAVEVAEAEDGSGVNLESIGEATRSSEDSNLVLESLLSDSSRSGAFAEEEAAVVEEEAAVVEEEPVAAEEEEIVVEEAAVVEEDPGAAEAEVANLLSDLERESAGDGELAALADEAVASADEEAVAGEEALVSDEAAAEGEQAAVSEAEVDDLLAGLEQDTVVGNDELSALGGEEPVEEAAAEEEPIAAAEEEEEKKPARPVKQRSRVPALVGGTFFGLLIGAGALIGARFAGVDVPAMIGVGEKKPAGPAVPQVKTPTFAERAAFVQRGDFEEAAKAGIEQIQENNPDELAERGSYRLGAYLQKSGAKVNLQDPPLQQAIADLQKAAEAKNLNAIYDLGLINELANKLAEARAEYTKGVNAAGNDPIQKRRFESALDRVELKGAGLPVPAALLLPERAEDRAALLALLLIGLQQPPERQPPQQQPPGQQPPAPPGAPPAAPPAQQQAGAEEAGFDFWQAAKLARTGKFVEAARALDKARTLHDTRRFTRLRKSQNPLSDPTEDIFLRCCDELKQYWLLESRLRDGGYLTDKNTSQDAIQALLKQVQVSSETLKMLADKLIMEKVIASAEDLPKGVDSVLKDRKDAETKVADLTKKLETAAKEATDLATKLKTAEETIKDRDTKLTDAATREKKLKTDNADLNTTLQKITDTLVMAKLLDPRGKPDLLAAVRKVVDVATIKDPQGMIRQQRSEIAQLTASLKERWQPEEMLPLWRLMLDENRGRPDLTKQAQLDVDRVKADPKATPVQKGEAEVVLGLALRNNEKFAEAKTVLESASTMLDKGDWLLSASAALKEVSNPAAYYALQAQRLYDTGRLDDALAVLDRGLKVLPEKEQGRLFAQRGLIELDAARSKARGSLPAKDPLVLAAQEDAARAAKANIAEGHYAAGRIAEELGQWDAAIASYRKALAAHPALDADGSRYRVALARVLLQPREPRPGQPANPAGEKVGWNDPAPYPARTWQEMKVFTLMLVLGLQAPPLPGEEPNLEEAEKLADEILKAPANTVPFNVRSQALAIKGRWTLALQTYVVGVRPYMPREYGRGLEYLVLNHPRLKRPDSLRVPNPLEAEKHFAAGLNFYFDRAYNNAEKEFLLTVENDNQDARYFYYLGLARLAQSKRRDAFADFDEGATLERLNRPAPAAVSESLERIQGPLRRIVNEVRTRPLER